MCQPKKPCRPPGAGLRNSGLPAGVETAGFLNPGLVAGIGFALKFFKSEPGLLGRIEAVADQPEYRLASYSGCFWLGANSEPGCWRENARDHNYEALRAAAFLAQPPRIPAVEAGWSSSLPLRRKSPGASPRVAPRSAYSRTRRSNFCRYRSRWRDLAVPTPPPAGLCRFAS